MVENEPFCQSSSGLYDKMVGDPTKHFTWEVFGSEGELIDVSDQKVDFVNYAENQIHGKCFSVPIQIENTVITKVRIQSELEHADVIFTSPGNWYTDEFKYWHFDHDTDAEVDINNELFEVLDFDGEECSRYGVDQQEETRDQCVKKYIEDQLWGQFGCFTPFHHTHSVSKFLFQNSVPY